MMMIMMMMMNVLKLYLGLCDSIAWTVSDNLGHSLHVFPTPKNRFSKPEKQKKVAKFVQFLFCPATKGKDIARSDIQTSDFSPTTAIGPSPSRVITSMPSLVSPFWSLAAMKHPALRKDLSHGKFSSIGLRNSLHAFVKRNCNRIAYLCLMLSEINSFVCYFDPRPHGNKARSHGREGVRGQKASSMEARCACIVLLSGVHVFAEAKSWRVQWSTGGFFNERLRNIPESQVQSHHFLC